MQKPICIFHLVASFLVQLTAKQLESRIVGGEFANIIYHPHSTFLRAKCFVNGERKRWSCGASIVNQNILLTAGHCLYGCDSSAQIFVHVGSTLREQGRPYRVYSFMIHGDYDELTTSNDICLLKTHQPIEFSKNVSRVALMRKPPYSEQATVAGWGYIDEEKTIKSTHLKFINLNVWSRSDCLETLREIPQGTICAAADSTTEHPLQGDSGSALVVRGYIQIGLVSFMLPARANHLIVYTDVGYYYDWIKYNSRDVYCLYEKIN